MNNLGNNNESKKKTKTDWKRSLINICLFGLFTLGGYGLGSFLGANIKKSQTGGPDLVWLIAGSVLAVYLVLLTHELGHLLAGRLAGMRPFLLISGPFRVVMNEKGLEIGWNRNLALMGGLAACMPGTTGDMRRQLMILAAGGPLTSLLAGIIGLMGAWLLPGESLAGILSLIFGLAGLGIFLATMIPGKTSGFMTDGAQLISLWRGGPEVKERMALMLLQAESLSGIRPRDFSPDLLKQVTGAPANSLTGIAGNLMAYYHYLDRGEATTAGDALLRVIEQMDHIPQGLMQAVHLEYAYYLAVYLGDIVQAEQSLRKGLGTALVEKHTKLRCEAAVLWAQGNTSQAAALAEQARTFAKRSMDRGAALAEREWLDQLITT